MSGWLVVSSVLAAGGIAVSYATVLFDAFGGYEVAGDRTADGERVGYLASPYWVGMPAAAIRVTVGFQALAAVGYVAWLVHVVTHPPTRGLFVAGGTTLGLHAAHLLFLVSSAVWPWLAHACVTRPDSVAAAVTACVPLWSAAAGVLLLVAGTFEAQYASAVPYLGILALALVVVLADGVGWAATAIFRAVHSNR